MLQKGVRWGSGEASYLLGMCYRQGFGGVQTDQHLAARYLAMALVRNASEASIELARMYLDGAGPLKQDLARSQPNPSARSTRKRETLNTSGLISLSLPALASLLPRFFSFDLSVRPCVHLAGLL